MKRALLNNSRDDISTNNKTMNRSAQSPVLYTPANKDKISKMISL